MKIPVLIVGGGLAGLTCAVELERRGVEYRLLEASDALGGRVRTDEYQGFLLDRGFQILLTAYPELRRLWNYQHLRLRPLKSGALIWSQGRWLSLPDPLKEPRQLLATLRSPVGTLTDKLKLAWMVLLSLGWREPALEGGRDSRTTREFLKQWGFSTSMLENFWRPFFGGVFLDDELETGDELFRFLFGCFAWGKVAVPAGGMQQIPLQMQRRLTPERAILGRRVVRREGRECWDDQGGHWQPEHLVLAVDGSSASELVSGFTPVRWRGTHCSYFAAPTSVGGGGRLHLNSQPDSCVHHLLVLSDSAPEYAPPGQALISVSSQTTELPDEQQLRQELGRMFSDSVVDGWRLLRQYSLPRSLPAFEAQRVLQPLFLGDGIFCCGDYLAYGSLNAAVKTGRIVAESLGYGEPR